MIRLSTRSRILALIVFCLVAAAFIWLASPPPAPPPAVGTTITPAPEGTFQSAALLPSHALPDRRFTPGAINPDVTQVDIDSTICVPGFTRSIRPSAHYTSRLKRAQLDDPARGYDDRNMRDFEEDHDVPLEAGGKRARRKGRSGVTREP